MHKYRISVKQTFQYKHFPSDYRKTARIFNVLEKNTKHLSKKFLNGEYEAWNPTNPYNQHLKPNYDDFPNKEVDSAHIINCTNETAVVVYQL
jgi:hypothetical protein